ncbi:hypothetical protein MRX96_019243 [Rhipicephalus microplus]
MQVPDSALVFDKRIQPPDLPHEIPPSCSWFSEDMAALTPIRPDTTVPYPTSIVSNAMYFLPLHKAGLPEEAKKMGPDQTQPYLQMLQTFISEDAQMPSFTDTRFSRNVSFKKTEVPSRAEVNAVENLSRTSYSAVASLVTACARDTSREATGSATSENSAAGLLPEHELHHISFRKMAHAITKEASQSIRLQLGPPAAGEQAPAFQG